jgi:long-chain acyl-CoA synthetase
MAQEDLVIHKLFSQIAQRFADRVALQIREDSHWRRFTYKEVDVLARKIGAFLTRQGYRKGDCAALILENSPEWAIIYLGIMYAQLTCVAIDYELSEAELDGIFRDCKPLIAFTSDKILQKKINHTSYRRLKVITVDSPDFDKIKTGQYENILFPEVSSSDVASLIYTSGTTAMPKGVILTHYNFCSNFRSIEKVGVCSPKDNFLSILPLYHTYAFMVTLLVPLLMGAKVTYAKGFKPEDLAGIIKEANVTVLVGVPQLFSLIYRSIFEKIKKLPLFSRFLIMPLIRQKVRNRFGRSLRLLVSGGARLESEVAKGLTRFGLKTIEGYGLTETSPVATLNPPERPKFGSVGKAIPDVQVKILNPDSSGIGEVLIKGPNVMQGYFKRPDLTARVISSDGWFNSQDLGYIDSEGYLFLTGRKKDVIVLSSGKNIYPEELEEYYGKSPYIKEICVLEKIDERFGQKIKLLFAVVVPDFGYFRKQKVINIREKIRWELENMSSKLPPYKRIMGFMVTKEELPRTHLKKIKRYEVYQRYLGHVPLEELERPEISEEDKRILDSEIAQKVIKYLSSQLNKKVDLHSHLEIDLGIDSLARVELGLGLESFLSINIPEEFIDDVLTVRELVVNIQRIVQGAEGALELPGEQKQKTWAEILNEQPPREVLEKIRITSGLLEKILTWAFKNLFECIFRLGWSLRINGKRLIPTDGPYVFCPSHASYLDGFVLFASVPLRCANNLFFIGHAKIFEHPLVKWAVKIARLISIDPVTHLTEALRAARFVLENKKLICVFPEAGRSIDNRVQEFKKGIGILAKELNVPLIPVYIKGSHFAWPRTRKIPRFYPLKITFGKPVFWQDLGGDYETIARGLREEVLKLKAREGDIK